MSERSETVSVTARVETTDSDPPWHIPKFPKSKVSHFSFNGNLRRVLCTLNGSETLQCSLFPSGGDYFITLSKKLRQKLGLSVGDQVALDIEKDESKFGMPMPEEFAEVLRQDRKGEQLFNALRPGDQRLMLKLIVFVKNSEKPIIRSLVGIEVLKQSGGQFDYHVQHDAMREACLSPERIVSNLK